MALRVVGAGLGRTGTLSLKLALERLLGAPCYHMAEVLAHPEQIPTWHAAARGAMPHWEALFDGYAASVDWPGAAFWRELQTAFPDALVLLSMREPEPWWRSADRTILPTIRRRPEVDAPGVDAWHAMVVDLMRHRFDGSIDDASSAQAAFVRHNERVKAEVPAERLLVWQPGDGWDPLCRGLGCPVPDEPFPHRNSTEEFREHLAASRPLDQR